MHQPPVSSCWTLNTHEIDMPTDITAAVHAEQMHVGRLEMNAGKEMMRVGREEIISGRSKMNFGRSKLDPAKPKMNNDSLCYYEVEAGSRAKVDVVRAKQTANMNAAKMNAAKVKMNAGRGKMNSGRLKILAGRVKMNSGRMMMNAVTVFLPQAIDLISCIFRAYPAGEVSIRDLHVCKLVCKMWRASACLVLADALWLAPFHAAAEGFLGRLRSHGIHFSATEIVLGMYTYRSRASVQEAGLRALRNLVQMMSMINDTETVMAGALDCIVVAMMEHREHAGVQEEGCAVLVNLAYNDNHKIAIASSGGLVILLAAMTAHMG